MIIGLILLSLTAILLFFKFSERFLEKINLKTWMAFIFILAFCIGAIVPAISMGKNFSVDIGGFIVPLILVIFLCISLNVSKELVRSLIAIVAVTGTAVAVRMLILPGTIPSEIAVSVILGFVCGAVAFVIGTSRLSTLIASIGGMLLGDLISALILRFILHKTTSIALGGNGLFNALILSACFAIILLEGIGFIRRAMTRKRISRSALNMEAASDEPLTLEDVNTIVVEEDFEDYFADEGENE